MLAFVDIVNETGLNYFEKQHAEGVDVRVRGHTFISRDLLGLLHEEPQHFWRHCVQRAPRDVRLLSFVDLLGEPKVDQSHASAWV